MAFLRFLCGSHRVEVIENHVRIIVAVDKLVAGNIRVEITEVFRFDISGLLFSLARSAVQLAQILSDSLL